MLRQSVGRIFKSLSLRFTAAVIVVQIIIAGITGTIYARNFTDELEARSRQNAQVPIELLNDGVLEYNIFGNREEMENIIGQPLVNAFIVGANDNIFFSVQSQFLGTSFQDYATTSKLQPLDLFALTETVSLIGSNGQIIVAAPVISEDKRTVRFYAFLEVSNEATIIQRNELLQLFIFGGLATVLFTSMVIYFLFDRIVFTRIRSTLVVLEKVAGGNLSARIATPQQDEIGILQHGTNKMVAELESIVNTLEDRIEDRTRDLTISAEVSRQIAVVLNAQELLVQLVNLTLVAFRFYQVNVYLYTAGTQSLNLSAASGEAGTTMLTKGKSYHLQDEPGLVPLAARTRKPAVVNDVSSSTAHNKNDLLQKTLSEATFPMIFGDELIGVLDLQSQEIGRFTEKEIELFTSFANQIAVALRNASLFGEVQEARERAEQADRVKSAFLASMSHELRTPLNAIINFSKFLKRGLPGPINAEQEQLVTTIAESGQHLLNLINDVLDMSKIEAGSLKLWIEDNVNMLDIIQIALSYTKPLLADKPITIIQDLPETMPMMIGDRKRLLQIFLNILSNACKFTQEGQITIRVLHEDSHLLFSIADTGQGIAPDDYEGVFTAFKQTTSGLRQGGGTGLGMPICQKLVEAHQGQIWFESEVNHGTTFYVKLPVQSSSLLQLEGSLSYA